MSNSTQYALYKSRHSNRPKHAKPTRMARIMARIDSIRMWAEIAFAPLTVVA